MQILLTGSKGYIARSLEKYLSGSSKNFEVLKKSVRNFSDFKIPKATDVVIHTAALVHKNESEYTDKDYFDVNCDLTIKIAAKAKAEGVKHFIFFSTMAVYGTNKHVTEIDEHTPLSPTTMYGISKLEAEKRLMEMKDTNFRISIIRPPMIYGPSCPGNYALLSKLAKKIPLFPEVQNTRSMIFIDNLCEFIRQLIVNKDGGFFHPQDKDFIRTSSMVKEIAKVNNRRIILSKFSGFIITKIFGQQKTISKVFGDLTYLKDLSNYRDNSYQKVDFKEAIRKSEMES